MNNGYVSDFLKAAEEFRSTYGKIANDYMNNESSIGEKRENFTEDNDNRLNSINGLNDADIQNLQEDNLKQDRDIASHQATIEALNNGTHEALQGLSNEEKQIKADAMIQDYTSRIVMAKQQKLANDKTIAIAEQAKKDEIKANADKEKEFNKDYVDSEKALRQQVVDSINKFKESFNEVTLRDGTRVSNITIIKNEIQKKIIEIEFNRAKAVAEMNKLPQGDSRKGEYGRQLQALSEHLNGLYEFSNNLGSFFSLTDQLDKKYVSGNRYPDVVEMQRSFEEMGKLLSNINDNKIFYDKDVNTVIPSEKQEQTIENTESVEQENQAPEVVEETNKENENVESELQLPAVIENNIEQDKKDEEVKPSEQEPEIVNGQEAIDGPIVIENPSQSLNNDESSQSLNNDEPNLTNKMPRSNYNNKKTKSIGAKAVINKRRAFNNVAFGSPIVVLAGISLLSSPLSGLTLPLAAGIGLGAGILNVTQKRIFDSLKDSALKRKINEFAKHYDVEVVFDYDKQEAFFAKLDADGKYQIINDYRELQDRLIDKLATEGNTKDEVISKANELSKKYINEFKRISGGIDLESASTSFESAVTRVFDKIGGITPNVSVPDQTIEQGRKLYENSANKFKDLLEKKEEYHLTPEQIERIENDERLARDVASRQNSKISNVVKSMNDIKDKIVNSKIVKNAADFLKPDEDLFEEYEKEYEEENLKNQKSEVVEKPTIVDGKIVNEETIKNSTFEDTLNEDDLMKESEELQNDDVIVKNPNITKSSENDEQLDNLEKKLNEFADDVKKDAINDIQTKENLSEEDRKTLKSIMNVNIQNALESGDTAYYDKLVQEYYEQFPEEKPVQENGYGMSK